MADTEVRLFRAADKRVPLIPWLENLRKKNPAVWRKCIARIRDLIREGHKLQRPLAAALRDQIYELRPKNGRPNYRILYFFHNRKAILTHGLTKEREVPDEDIEFAIYCRELVRLDEDKYTADFT